MQSSQLSPTEPCQALKLGHKSSRPSIAALSSLSPQFNLISVILGVGLSRASFRKTKEK